MELRGGYKDHPKWTASMIFTVLTLTVSNIYVKASNDLLNSLGIYGIDNALASFSIRFIISGLGLFLLYILLYQPPKSIKEYRKILRVVKGHSWKTTIGCGLLSFTIFVIVSVTTLITLDAFTVDPLAFLKQPSETTMGWLWPLFALNPGLFEETGFRGILYTNLRRTYPEKTVIKWTAVLFGLFHFTGLANGQPIVGVVLIAITAATMGYSWSYTTARTGSVVPSMIIHYLVNALSEVLQQANTTNEVITIIHILSLAIVYPIASYIVLRSMTQNIKAKTNCVHCLM